MASYIYVLLAGIFAHSATPFTSSLTEQLEPRDSRTRERAP